MMEVCIRPQLAQVTVQWEAVLNLAINRRVNQLSVW